MKSLGLFALLLVALPPFLSAQNGSAIDTGLLAYHDYHGGDIDKVNIDNGNLTFMIPLVSYPQRGTALKLDYAVVSNTMLRSFVESCPMNAGKSPPSMSCTDYWYTAQDTLPPQKNFAFDMSVPRLTDMEEVVFSGRSVPSTIKYYTNPYNVVGYFTTSDGARHAAGQTSSGQISLDGSDIQNGMTWAPAPYPSYTPTCNWGCSFSGALAGLQSFATKDGVTYLGKISSGAPEEDTSVEARVDAQGNYILSNSSGTTDTVGRFIPEMVVVNSPTSAQLAACAATLPTTGIYSWAPPGYSQPFLFCYAAVRATAPWEVWTYYSDPSQGTTETVNTLSVAQPVLQRIVLPNGQAWTFEYNENATNCPDSAQIATNLGDVTGIVFPTGGSIRYTYTCLTTGMGYPIAFGGGYTNGNGPITTAVSSRTVDANDGTGPHAWTYTYAVDYSVFQPQTTTLTSPSGDDTVETLNATKSGTTTPATRITKSYQGHQSGGALLRTETRTYPYQYAANWGFPQYATSSTTTLDNNLSTTTQFTFCCDFSFGFLPNAGQPSAASWGKITDSKVYDYTTGSLGALLNETRDAYVFQSNSAYVQPGFFDLKSTETVLDGLGNTVALSTLGYDETTPVISGIASLSGSQMVAPFYSVYGNQTSKTSWLNTGPTNPQSTFRYYDTGELYQSTDPLGHITTYQYSSTYMGALPTSISNALNQQSTFTYRTDTGQKLTATDPNSQTTNYAYNDPSIRLTSIKSPDAGETDIQYNDSGNIGVTATKKITSSSDSPPNLTMQTQAIVDGLGRASETILLSDPSGPTYTRTTYDALGRKYQVWNPTRCSPPTTNCGESTWGYTTFGYDALSRMTSQIDSDLSNTQSWTYSGNTVTSKDEAGNQWKRTSDALGRLTQVLEPNGTSKSPTMVTNYTYNSRGDLTDVDQWGGATRNASTAVTRHFDYDTLSRLTQSHNPESGWVCYGTTNLSPANGANCTPQYDPNGNLMYKTDARGVQVYYSYDSLNRVTDVSYSAPTPLPAGYVTTSPVHYNYDEPAGVYGNGRRTSMTDGAGSQSWTYDKMGRSATISRSTKTSSTSTQTNSATFAYNIGGLIEKSVFFALGSWATYTYAGDGRPTALSWASNNLPYVSGATYAPSGQLTAMSMGGGGTSTYPISISKSYNNRLQPTTLTAGTSLQSYFNHTLSYSSSANNGNIANDSDILNTHNVTSYSYDTLNRLTGAQSPGGGSVPAWSESNGSDPFGNLNAKTDTATSQISFSTSATQSNQFPPSILQYDLAGNVIHDNQATSYTWDAEDRIVSAGNVTYSYDGDGRRVLKSNPSAPDGSLGSVYWYGPDGSMTDETTVAMNGSNPRDLQRNFYFDGKMIARQGFPTSFYTSDFIISDQLGSTRVAVDMGSLFPEYINYFPFGGYLGTPPSDKIDQKFTGKIRDTETGNDYFGARNFTSNLGRLLSPDDGGDQEPDDPQSWNLYGYVRNNPLIHTDPNGNDCVTQTRTSSTTETVSVSSGSCTGASGNGTTQTYVDGKVNLSDIGVAADGHSISIGFTASDGSGSGVQNAESAPIPDNPGIAVGYNRSGFAQLSGLASFTNRYLGAVFGAETFFIGSMGEAAIGAGLGKITPMVRIIEQDGDAIEAVVQTARGPVKVMANMTKEGDKLVLTRVHVDGEGLTRTGIKQAMRALGRQEGVSEVEVQGGVRTSGANPGSTPTPIRVRVDD